MRNAYKILARKPEELRSLGTPRCKWEDDIKTDLEEIGCEYRPTDRQTDSVFVVNAIILGTTGDLVVI
jgi:hypothetical protein